jgi:hypothetical protein
MLRTVCSILDLDVEAGGDWLQSPCRLRSLAGASPTGATDHRRREGLRLAGSPDPDKINRSTVYLLGCWTVLAWLPRTSMPSRLIRAYSLVFLTEVNGEESSSASIEGNNQSPSIEACLRIPPLAKVVRRAISDLEVAPYRALRPPTRTNLDCHEQIAKITQARKLDRRGPHHYHGSSR